MYAKWGMTQAGKITQLIMFCVQAPNITMPSNGSRLPGFTPTRGLRQGDPVYYTLLFSVWKNLLV